jgi:antitoxin FitA
LPSGRPGAIILIAFHEGRNHDMPHILVRDLDPETIERLKARAKRHGRSLQGEAKAILEGGATFSMREARAVSEKWQRYFKGRQFTDSAKLIREDRNR